jgi:hypothetical protein
MSRLPRYIDSPSPSPPDECVLPPTKAGVTHSPGGEGDGGQYFGRPERGGGHTRQAERGMGSQYILEDQRDRIALLQ